MPELSHPQGLTESDAKELLLKHGPNELPASKPKSPIEFLLASVREPMILLLLACASIYIFMGEIQDSVLLLLSVFAVIGISFYQEYRSGRAVEALRDLTSPRARVLRDGIVKRIAGRAVVPGDYLLLSEGERIPADATLLESNHLQVDESLLTGESVPVDKTPSRAGDKTAKLFASTLVTRGTGTALVITTGAHTEVGKIGHLLSGAPEERTRLQNEMTRIVQIFGSVAVLFSAIVAAAHLINSEDWPRALLAGLASAMALLPEEFPVILTVFLALGAWRLSKKNVLVRQPTATENLGAVTALCVDKTGTLTMNQMTVTRIYHPSMEAQDGVYAGSASLTKVMKEVIEFGALASHEDLFDPMEKAIRAISNSSLGTVVREYPLSPRLLAMSRVWQAESKAPFVIATKGAPEAVLRLCRMTPGSSKNVVEVVDQMSNEGLRVIAVARAETSHSSPQLLPKSQEDFDFAFVGLIGLRDPVRAEVPNAVAECHAAGIRVIMITGDYAGTALQIAKIAGLKNTTTVLTGDEIEQMDDLELSQNVRHTDVFARMVPNQKLRIVNALKMNGEVVAMTGDGVNDAPSLKWADVGIAMGERGTDVAREASDLVLLDDCFTSIVSAIRSGRKIFENIKHAIGYVFAIHIPIAGMASLPVFLGLPPALFPAHIVFMELIIDPTCSLIFESLPPGPETMLRPPRRIDDRIFNRRDFTRSSLQGVLMLVAILASFLVSLEMGASEELARTFAFAIFVFSNLGLIAINQTEVIRSSYSQFLLVAGLAVTALVITVYVPFLRSIFGFEVMGPAEWLIAMATAFVASATAWMIKGR